jgi:hypothetical protein
MGETINKILINVDISDAKPDGRPLYEYKISKEIFLNIKNLLTVQWNDNEYTHALFVIYASELIRKEHTDGHLNWNNLFNPIGKNEFNNHNQRSNIVLKGLKFWGRSVFISENGAEEYIETLRLESGFPLNERGNIAQLVKSTFQQIENFVQNENDLMPFIMFDSERFNIPNVLKQDSFYRLISNICFKLFEWKSKYELGKQQRPVEYLSIQRPNWKDELPMRIDGVNMISFFNNLISEISKIEKEVRNIIKVESKLIETQEKIFDIKTYLNIPKGIYTHEAFGIDETVFNELNGDISIYFECEGTSYYITKMSITVDRKVSSLGLNNFSLPESLIGHKWSLYFTSSNSGLREEINLKNVIDFDNEEPKVFVEENSEWLFKGIAPIKIKEFKCRVVFNSHYNVQDSNATIIGKTLNEYFVLEAAQDCKLRNNVTSADYVIKLNQQSDNSNVIHFIDKQFPARNTYNYLTENKNVYIGFPKVLIYNKVLGINGFFNGTIEYSVDSRWDIFDKSSSLWGIIKFRFKDRRGDIIAYKTLTILPKDLTIHIDANPGVVNIQSNEKFQVYQLRAGLDHLLESANGQTTIIINPIGEDALKSFINLKLVHPNFDLIDFKVPNPNLAEVFVNGDNQVIKHVEFSLSKIQGLGIQFNEYSGERDIKKLEIFLEDEYQPDLKRLKITKIVDLPGNSSKRVPLYQYIPLLNLLFSLTRNTRAKVRISLANNNPHMYIHAKIYDFELKYNGNDNLLYMDDHTYTGNLDLNAFRLDKEFTLNKLLSISLENKSDVMCKLPEDGSWFVYGSNEFSFKIAPKVIVKGDSQINGDPEIPINALSEGSNLKYLDRIKSFKEFFDARYLDFSHDVWRELYDLYQATKHLPMNALDVWKGLVKSPKGMLTFLFSEYRDPKLIKQLTDQLGFLWQLVSIHKWNESFNTWLDIDTNIHNIEDLKSTLDEILGLKNLLINLNKPDMEEQFNNEINVAINGTGGKPGVRGRHDNGSWPTYAYEFINTKFNQLPTQIKNIIPCVDNRNEKSVIFLPVILAYHSVNGNYILVNELSPEILLSFKLNMDFDRTYFDDVYAKIQGFCINQIN